MAMCSLIYITIDNNSKEKSNAGSSSSKEIIYGLLPIESLEPIFKEKGLWYFYCLIYAKI